MDQRDYAIDGLRGFAVLPLLVATSPSCARVGDSAEKTSSATAHVGSSDSDDLWLFDGRLSEPESRLVEIRGCEIL